ncbi:MAG: GNAT family N-acetyltransferase [Rudaea sp.]|uniref:GNAT family N-acetyltransferase n=1 Tax=Rudaea sp. TaxID=2136325 RepID=UPI0039E247AF
MDTLANPGKLAERWALPRHGRGLRPPPRRSERRTPQRSAAGGGERLTARDGTPLVLRPIRPDDVEVLQRFFHRLTPEEVRLRFLHPLNELPDAFAHQLCELDPALAFAWVLATPDDPAHADLPVEIHAVARAHFDPVLAEAEFAIVVEGRFARQGFGSLLMRRTIASARKLGAIELWSDVLYGNGAMLDLCAKLGFERGMSLNNPGVVRVSLAL